MMREPKLLPSMSTKTPSPNKHSRNAGAAAKKDEARPRSRAVATPRIREMRPASCLALLRRQTVGRMAFSFHDRVDITPIHYVYSEGWLFARTSHGAKMTTIQHVPWVALEVDEVRSVFDWQSVVVHGTVYMMERDAGPTEARLWSKGIKLLQRLVPGTGTDDDPVPFRTLVFGIHASSMSGRKSSTAGGTGA